MDWYVSCIIARKLLCCFSHSVGCTHVHLQRTEMRKLCAQSWQPVRSLNLILCVAYFQQQGRSQNVKHINRCVYCYYRSFYCSIISWPNLHIIIKKMWSKYIIYYKLCLLFWWSATVIYNCASLMSVRRTLRFD